MVLKWHVKPGGMCLWFPLKGFICKSGSKRTDWAQTEAGPALEWTDVMENWQDVRRWSKGGRPTRISDRCAKQNSNQIWHKKKSRTVSKFMNFSVIRVLQLSSRLDLCWPFQNIKSEIWASWKPSPLRGCCALTPLKSSQSKLTTPGHSERKRCLLNSLSTGVI